MGIVSLRTSILVLAAALASPTWADPASVPAAPVATKPAATLVGGANFISPMGEPFRSHDSLSGAEHWFEQADADHDGRITMAEMRADADRFFAILDRNHDGEIGPDEISYYENDIAPEIQVMSTMGDMSQAKTDDDGNVTYPPYPTRLGAGRFGYLDMPEPVVSADGNFDRAISRSEFEMAADRRFKMLDTNADGAITRDELPKLGSVRGDGGGGKRGRGSSRTGSGHGHHGGMGSGGMGGMGDGGMGSSGGPGTGGPY